MKLFLDLDGVFANFDKRMSELFGLLWEQDESTIWEEVVGIAPRLFREFDLLPGADRLLEEAKQWEQAGSTVQFLTALPARIHMPYAAPDKIHWVRETLGSTWQVTFGPFAKDKRYHCTGKDCVLVDDSKINIEQWIRKKGIGILHDPEDVERTLRCMEKIRC